MTKTEAIHNIIKELEQSQAYLESRCVDGLVYPLQKLDFEDWENIQEKLLEWNQTQLRILKDGIVEIGNNKKSNFDTGGLFGRIFVLSDDDNTEELIENFLFINNGIPKRVKLIDAISSRLELFKSKKNMDFEAEFKIVNQLYENAVC